jgi:hypothetical protein
MRDAEELQPRGRRPLCAALVAGLVRDGDNPPDPALVHERLNFCFGIGLIIAGMTHQGWDVELTAYAARDWRANFFPVGIAHSIVGGSAWEPTPWRAVQGAAWAALNKREAAGGGSSRRHEQLPRTSQASQGCRKTAALSV